MAQTMVKPIRLSSGSLCGTAGRASVTEIGMQALAVVLRIASMAASRHTQVLHVVTRLLERPCMRVVFG